MWSPRLVLITNFTVKILKVGGFEIGSDGSSLCNFCEVSIYVTERIGLFEASSMF